MYSFYLFSFFHLSGSSSLYFSSDVLGCHSAVLFMTSVRYSNRFTLFILQVSAIVQSMASRSVPLWLPKSNEFFLDNDMQRFIRSTILLSRQVSPQLKMSTTAFHSLRRQVIASCSSLLGNNFPRSSISSSASFIVILRKNISMRKGRQDRITETLTGVVMKIAKFWFEDNRIVLLGGVNLLPLFLLLNSIL